MAGSHPDGFSPKKWPQEPAASVFCSLRTLCFEDYGDSEESDSSSLAAKMCRRLCQKFGLESDGSMAQTVLQPICNILPSCLGIFGERVEYVDMFSSSVLLSFSTFFIQRSNFLVRGALREYWLQPTPTGER